MVSGTLIGTLITGVSESQEAESLTYQLDQFVGFGSSNVVRLYKALGGGWTSLAAKDAAG